MANRGKKKQQNSGGGNQQKALNQGGHAGTGGGHTGQQSGGMGGMHGGDLHDAGSGQSGMTGRGGMGGNESDNQQSGGQGGQQGAGAGNLQQEGFDDIEPAEVQQSAQREGMGHHRHSGRGNEQALDADKDVDSLGNRVSSAGSSRAEKDRSSES